MKKLFLLLIPIFFSLFANAQENSAFALVGRIYGDDYKGKSWEEYPTKYTAGAYGMQRPKHIVRDWEDLYSPCQDYIEIDSMSALEIMKDSLMYIKLHLYIPYTKDFIHNQGDKGNALSCNILILQGDTMKFSPRQLAGYNVDCRIYVSKNVFHDGEKKLRFLELITNNDMPVYYLKENGKHYYTENNGVLIELSNNMHDANYYKTILNTLYGDCESVAKYMPSMKFTPYSMRKLGKEQEKCSKLNEEFK